jgi:hypothetical protein
VSENVGCDFSNVLTENHAVRVVAVAEMSVAETAQSEEVAEKEVVIVCLFSGQFVIG